MDKLKNILSPGHKKDDDVLYGNADPDQQFINKGAVAGEGSHFPSVNETAAHRTPGAFIDDDADAATTASIKSGIAGEPQSGATPSTAPAAHPAGLSNVGQTPVTSLSQQDPGSTTTGPSTFSGNDSIQPKASTSLMTPSSDDTAASATAHKGIDNKAPAEVIPASTGKTTAAPVTASASDRGTGQTSANPLPSASGKTTFTPLATGPSSTGTSSKIGDEPGLSNSKSTTAAIPPTAHPTSSNTASRSGLSSGPSGITATQSSGTDSVGFCEPNESTAPIAPPESHITETARRLDPKYHGPTNAITPATTLEPSEIRGSLGTSAVGSQESNSRGSTIPGSASSAPSRSQDAGASPVPGHQHASTSTTAPTAGVFDSSTPGTSSQAIPASASADRQLQQHDHAKRDAALLGTAGAGAGVALHETAKHSSHPSKLDDPNIGGQQQQALGSNPTASNSSTLGSTASVPSTSLKNAEPTSTSKSTAPSSSTVGSTKTGFSAPYAHGGNTSPPSGTTILASSALGSTSADRSAAEPVSSFDQAPSSVGGQSNGKPDHGHSARDAAILGGAAGGAGGFAAYEASKEPESGTSNLTSADPSSSGGLKSRFEEHDTKPTSTNVGGTYLASSYDKGSAPSNASTKATQQTQPAAYSGTEDPSTRDKALLGAAAGGTALGAGGLAAQERRGNDLEPTGTTKSPSQPHQGVAAASAPVDDQKEAKKLEKEHDKEVKAAEKQHEKEIKKLEKEHEKDVKSAQKEEEKVAKKEQKEHEKQAAIVAKEHEKEEKKAEKEAKKEEEKEDGEKKPSLVHRLLHRHDDEKKAEKEHKREEEGLHDPNTGRRMYPNDPRDSLDKSESNETDQLGIGKTTHDAYQTTDGQNKLHKKHPPGHVLEQLGGSSGANQ